MQYCRRRTPITPHSPSAVTALVTTPVSVVLPVIPTTVLAGQTSMVTTAAGESLLVGWSPGLFPFSPCWDWHGLPLRFPSQSGNGQPPHPAAYGCSHAVVFPCWAISPPSCVHYFVGQTTATCWALLFSYICRHSRVRGHPCNPYCCYEPSAAAQLRIRQPPATH